MSRLSHLNEAGQAHMVDVSGKPETSRRAVAESRLRMRSQTLEEIAGGGIAKGDVFAAARIAGIQGAKRTSELIPLCHPLALNQVEVDFELPDEGSGAAEETELVIRCSCRVSGRTGVEMEALTGASWAWKGERAERCRVRRG